MHARTVSRQRVRGDNDDRLTTNPLQVETMRHTLLLRRWAARWVRSRPRGQSVVEFALVMPLLLMFFAAAADLGRAFYNYVALENAVKEGALYGSRYPLCDDTSPLCPNPDNVRWRVENEARTAAGDALVTPSSACRNATTGVPYTDLRDCVAGDTYVVRASLAFHLLTPILSQVVGGSMTLTSESSAIVLNQAFDPTPGLAPTKLILGTTALNAAELASRCQQPDPVGAPGYYRSPCQDSAGVDVYATFSRGDPISYKMTVRNNGGTNVTSVTMTDSRGWPAGCPAKPTTLAVNASYTCSYVRTAPSSSPYSNTLTVDGIEIDPTVDGATVLIPADLLLSKSVSPYKLGSDGDGNPSFGTASAIDIFFNAQIPSPSVWYNVEVVNDGGTAATGLTVQDSSGALPYGTADCPALPASLAPDAVWSCLYQTTFTTAQSTDNTVTASGGGSTPPSADATVTVAQCTGANRVVPNLIGKDKTTGPAAWSAAGFTGAYGNINNGTVVTQNRQAFSCLPATTSILVTKGTTP
jgi:uncharacterized repeat protein (TIGR01451 family)